MTPPTELGDDPGLHYQRQTAESTLIMRQDFGEIHRTLAEMRGLLKSIERSVEDVARKVR
jgi:hypothetical protein